MKRSFIILFLFITVSCFGVDWYVSPTGSDAATGADISHPWLTWHYAFNHTPASDTCYFRGGIYPPYSTSIGVELISPSNSGTRTHPTCLFAYPADFAAGNYPVLDCQTMTKTINQIGIFIAGSVYNFHLKGLHVRNVRQVNTNAVWGILLWRDGALVVPNNITYENCAVYNIGGMGFDASAVDTVYYINCDAYNCCDSLAADPGGRGSGFYAYCTRGEYALSTRTYHSFYGCRAWMCSDQGYEVTTAGKAVFDHCWSIHNGDVPFPANIYPKGSGWKIYYRTSHNAKNSSVVQFELRNSIAAYNAHIGINFCDHALPSLVEIRSHIYNNFIYGNNYTPLYVEDAFGWGVNDEDNTDTVGRWDHKYYNNVSYNNKGYPVGTSPDVVDAGYPQSNNYFNIPGSPVNATWFLSLDTTGMIGLHEREADWSLPETNFGRPSSTSPLINAGIDVGLPYDGAAPDIGWVEYTTAEPPTVPLVATYNPTNVNIRQGTASGIVTYDGGGTVSERGICWDTSTNPLITDNKVAASAGGLGSFTVTLTGLSSNTTYYMRAYATNETDTGYGENKTFTTPKWNKVKYGTKVVTYNGVPVIVR